MCKKRNTDMEDYDMSEEENESADESQSFDESDDDLEFNTEVSRSLSL